MFVTSTYSWIVLLHVTAAMLLIGSAVASFHTTQAMVDASSASALRTLLDVFRRVAAAGRPLALSVLISGVSLGSYGWWTQPWFYIAIGLWILQATLAARVLRPHAQALAATIRPSDTHISAEVAAVLSSRSWLVAAAVMHGNDFAMLYLMVNKPSPFESLIVIVMAQTACVLIETSIRRRRAGGVAARSAAA